MRVEKVNRDHRYTSRQRLLMLLLLCASAVAALVASKQIPLTPSLDMQAPRALEGDRRAVGCGRGCSPNIWISRPGQTSP